MDDVEVVERQVFERDAHGSPGAWLLRELELDPKATTGVAQEQIELGAAVRPPEERFTIPAHTEDLLQAEPLPRCPQLRVRLQARPIDEHAEQRKKVGPALNFVENHEALERPQHKFGIGQPGEIGRRLEVEEMRRYAALSKLTCPMSADVSRCQPKSPAGAD